MPAMLGALDPRDRDLEDRLALASWEVSPAAPAVVLARSFAPALGAGVLGFRRAFDDHEDATASDLGADFGDLPGNGDAEDRRMERGAYMRLRGAGEPGARGGYPGEILKPHNCYCELRGGGYGSRCEGENVCWCNGEPPSPDAL